MRVINISSSVIQKTSEPRWNSKWQFEDMEDNEAGDLLTIAIYDEDSLGSDELVCTQTIPLKYFRDSCEFGKPIDLWLRLDYVNNNNRERIVVETDSNIYQDLNMPEFEEQIIKSEVEKDNDGK